MKFNLNFTEEAWNQLLNLRADPSLKKQGKAVQKALAFMEVNLRHSSLHTHKYESLTKRYEEEIFESYAESNTPAAYRIFWKYGPKKSELTIIAIIPHP